MAYFVTLSGPVIFDEIKLLYPAGNFEEAAFDDLISKLKNRLDKIEPDLVQRYKFSTRVQNPDETMEDFVLALKLQAEFCGFATFKDTAILDRIIAGIKDKNLRQRLGGRKTNSSKCGKDYRDLGGCKSKRRCSRRTLERAFRTNCGHP